MTPCWNRPADRCVAMWDSVTRREVLDLLLARWFLWIAMCLPCVCCVVTDRIVDCKDRITALHACLFVARGFSVCFNHQVCDKKNQYYCRFAKIVDNYYASFPLVKRSHGHACVHQRVAHISQRARAFSIERCANHAAARHCRIYARWSFLTCLCCQGRGLSCKGLQLEGKWKMFDDEATRGCVSQSY